MSRDLGTAQELVEEAQAAIYALAEGTEDVLPELAGVDMDKEIELALELSRGERATPGLTTGWRPVDELVGGLYPGEVTVLAARTSVGKSSFTLDLSRRIAEQGKVVLYCSLEMRRSALRHKLLSAKANVDSRAFRRTGHKIEMLQDGEMLPALDRLWDAEAVLREIPLHLWDKVRVTPLDLRVRARQMKMDTGLDLVVVDYVGKLTPDTRGERHEQHAEMSRALGELAGDLEIPLIVCAQLNRDSDRRNKETGKMATPLLSQIRDSGRWEEDAHQVIFLQRDVAEQGRSTEIIVAKSRMGETGTRGLSFQYEYSRFDSTDERF